MKISTGKDSNCVKLKGSDHHTAELSDWKPSENLQVFLHSSAPLSLVSESDKEPLTSSSGLLSHPLWMPQ